MSEDAMANRGGIQDAKNLEARMSGKTAADYARELLEVTDEWAPAGDIDPSKLTAALAVAEERGRRSGVEAAITFLGNEGAFDLAHRLAVRHLAPRDSAPGSDCEIVGCQIIGKHEHPIGGLSEARK